MKIQKIIAFAAIAAFLFSCNSAEENQEKVLETTSTTEVSETVEEPETSRAEPTRNSYDIELIDNKKWKVNEEMMIHIRNMEADMLTYSAQAEKDYLPIAKTLKAHFGKLTKSSTMKGQAHDESHKWLLPFIDLVNDLRDVEEEDDHAAMYVEIEASMEEFNMYFE